jgi:hypothetical protein
VVFPGRTTLVTVKQTANPLVELGLPESLTQHTLADRPKPEGTSHGLLLPSAHSRIAGPLSAGFTCPLRSVLRVWLPSRRLTPRGSAPVLFRTGSAPGIYPSELSPSGRYPTRFRAEEPTYCFACRYTFAEARAGSTSRSSWVSALPGVPGDPRVFST